ncbi:hypothetical protein C3K47_19175 [Solitalea longa]|uniref:Guanylate cyclase domain-containing protein n=1 Tax=Solitalea longa TaxID=2079460 RepID=A0A2S4ZXN1_9SPHI|nr:hypothetical protein [Solitalea longa]POY34672.1 hypothetical protein C3K47_19175 [Solitalea longa]
MKNHKYLLYIDILGFADLVKTDYDKIRLLFKKIDELNVHRHNAFQTIVFSDTILILNKIAPRNTHEHEYLVMYACEFAQDLMFRCIDLEIQFRAILTYGDFFYEKLENIEAYHGKALVNAYYKEKDINSLGLFIDKSILQYNTIFKTTQFDKDLDFVFLTQNLERLCYFYDASNIPLDPFLIDQACEFPYLKDEVKILETLKKNIDTQIDSKIRGKYLQAYHFYQQRYKVFIDQLEKNDFDYKIVSPTAEWT